MVRHVCQGCAAVTSPRAVPVNFEPGGRVATRLFGEDLLQGGDDLVFVLELGQGEDRVLASMSGVAPPASS
jgi:hypothetical protein